MIYFAIGSFWLTEKGWFVLFRRKLVFLGTKIVSSSENHPPLLLTNFGQKCVKRLLEDEKLLVVVGVKKRMSTGNVSVQQIRKKIKLIRVRSLRTAD